VEVIFEDDTINTISTLLFLVVDKRLHNNHRR